MSNQNDRIIIVGAGPVGLTAALALARRGIPNVLLAAEPELVMELRGSTFHPPTLDLLDEFEVVPRMIEVGLKAPTWQFRDRETGRWRPSTSRCWRGTPIIPTGSSASSGS
jgi:3-(3-hydroxy-phenyl)propionate hydroxylase